jgi:cardiolipin synthase A/B
MAAYDAAREDVVIGGEWSTVGSMNLDYRSMAVNDESTLMVLDGTVGQQMNQMFLDDLRQAQDITAAACGQRLWTERIAERVANLMRRWF